MPARSKQQFKYIWALRDKYKSKKKAPKNKKWVFNKEWTKGVDYDNLPKKKKKVVENHILLFEEFIFEGFEQDKKLIEDIIQECLFDFLVKYQLSYSLDFTKTPQFDFCLLKICKELPTSNKKNEWPIKREYVPLIQMKGFKAASINGKPIEMDFFEVSDDAKDEYKKYMNHLKLSLEKEIENVKLTYPKFSFMGKISRWSAAFFVKYGEDPLVIPSNNEEEAIIVNNYISIVITFNYKNLVTYDAKIII